jgi:hypothetical protein
MRKEPGRTSKPWLIAQALACVAILSAPQPIAPAAAGELPLAQPANVGEAKRAAIAYRESGTYQRDIAIVTAAATSWIVERAPLIRRPAIVFDIDDTALTNWEVILANDFGRVFGGPCLDLPKGPCGWIEWDLLARSPVIPETLALYRQARASGVAVFFITGRDETQRAATVRNLREAGYADFQGLYMPAAGAHFASASDFKAPRRQRIEEAGYTIVANVGDQPSDLAGGYAEKTFLLPNPFYRIP